MQVLSFILASALQPRDEIKLVTQIVPVTVENKSSTVFHSMHHVGNGYDLLLGPDQKEVDSQKILIEEYGPAAAQKKVKWVWYANKGLGFPIHSFVYASDHTTFMGMIECMDIQIVRDLVQNMDEIVVDGINARQTPIKELNSAGTIASKLKTDVIDKMHQKITVVRKAIDTASISRDKLKELGDLKRVEDVRKEYEKQRQKMDKSIEDLKKFGFGFELGNKEYITTKAELMIQELKDWDVFLDRNSFYAMNAISFSAILIDHDNKNDVKLFSTGTLSNAVIFKNGGIASGYQASKAIGHKEIKNVEWKVKEFPPNRDDSHLKTSNDIDRILLMHYSDSGSVTVESHIQHAKHAVLSIEIVHE